MTRCILPKEAAVLLLIIALLIQLVLASNARGSTNDDGGGEYGVDVSFPHHHLDRFQSPGGAPPNPHGAVARERYADFMRGCREAYPDIARQCGANDEQRMQQNRGQPAAASIRNYTQTGFERRRCPPEIYARLRAFFEANRGREKEEKWDAANVFTNHWASPTYVIDIHKTQNGGGGIQLTRPINEVVGDIVEEWVGRKLKPVSVFGIRMYKNGSILSPHVDRHPLVSSAIINVGQDVDEDWPLEIIDRHGVSRNVTMQPGDMILYESHTLIHGRPFPLRGRYFANVFVHFQPLGSSEACLDESEECKAWAKDGECKKNPSYMLKSCAESCNLCAKSNGSSDEL